MKRWTFILIFFVLSMSMEGQLFPLSDHYIVNALPVNPAFAGSHEALSTTLSYRDQWTGFKDSPKSRTLSVHAPVFNDKVGLGLLVQRNSIGIFKETNIIGNYAYRMELNKGKLALGIGFGLTSHHNAWNELDAVDANDTKLEGNPENAVMPAFSLGTYYYTSRYFIGLSLPFFLSHVYDRGAGKYRLRNIFSEYNYFLTGGYRVNLGRQIALLPSLVVKYHPERDWQIDYTAQFILANRFGLGVGYRNGDTMVGMLQFQINNQLAIRYSYDYGLGKVGRYLNGSHEIVLGYLFKYERDVVGPRQF